MWLFAAFALLVIAVTAHDEIARMQGVLVLTPDNIDQALAEHHSLFIVFLSHKRSSKVVRRELPAMAAVLEAQTPPVQLAQLTFHSEGTNNPIGRRFKLKSLPSARLVLRSGAPVPYDGSLTSEHLSNWLRRRNRGASIPSVFIRDLNPIEEFKRDFRFREESIALFLGPMHGPAFAAFVSVSQKLLEGVRFFHSDNISLYELLDLRQDSTVVLFARHSPNGTHFEGDCRDADAILRFIQRERYPKWEWVEWGADESLKKIQKPIILYLRDSDPVNDERLLARAATSLRDRVRIYICDIMTDACKRLCHSLMVNVSSAPTLYLIDFTTKPRPRKYRIQTESLFLDGRSVEELYNAWARNGLAPEYRSEPLPSREEPQTGVRKLVRLAYDATVNDPTRDIMVRYTLPGCYHCNQTESLYRSVADKLSKIDRLRFYEIDIGSNELDVTVTNPPRLIFYPRGKKEGIVALYITTESALLEFLKLHATVPLDVRSEL